MAQEQEAPFRLRHRDSSIKERYALRKQAPLCRDAVRKDWILQCRHDRHYRYRPHRTASWKGAGMRRPAQRMRCRSLTLPAGAPISTKEYEAHLCNRHSRRLREGEEPPLRDRCRRVYHCGRPDRHPLLQHGRLHPLSRAPVVFQRPAQEDGRGAHADRGFRGRAPGRSADRGRG